VWYPQPGGGLAQEVPPADAAPSTFTFDPAQPTPTVGGPLLEVMGAPVAELAHRSDNPHADLFVRLSEVDARGRSRNVTEGYLRLDPGRDDALVRLELRPAAHRFAAGSRLRLYIAGGSHPQFARNLGTDENPGTGTGLRPATHSIAHAGPTASSLTLPRSPT
jgi:predicted acyl esterase